jgi:hypothetical protein
LDRLELEAGDKPEEEEEEEEDESSGDDDGEAMDV